MAARARTGEERARADRRGEWRRRDRASRGCSTSSRRHYPGRMQGAGSLLGLARQGVGLAAGARTAARLFWHSGRGRSGHATRESPCRACRARPGAREVLPYLLGLLGIQEGPDPLAQMDPQIKRRRTLEAIKRIIVREVAEAPAGRDLRGPCIGSTPRPRHCSTYSPTASLARACCCSSTIVLSTAMNGRAGATTCSSGSTPWAAKTARRCWRRCSVRGVELAAAQAADHRAHRRQSVLHRGDGAGAVRRGRVGAQRRSEGDALALATASAADGAGHPGRAHRPAFGGAEGTAADARGDRPGVAAWPDQESGLRRRSCNWNGCLADLRASEFIYEQPALTDQTYLFPPLSSGGALVVQP